MAFHGKQGRGAGKFLRENKRVEAEERNARTLPENRKAARKDAAHLQQEAA